MVKELSRFNNKEICVVPCRLVECGLCKAHSAVTGVEKWYINTMYHAWRLAALPWTLWFLIFPVVVTRI